MKSDMRTLQATLFVVRLKFFGYRETNTSPTTQLMSWLMLQLSHLLYLLSSFYNSGHF